MVTFMTIFLDLNLKMPPSCKMRGRPKGIGLTVIGQPRKKKVKSSERLLRQFRTLHVSSKKAKVLSWLQLPSSIISMVIKGSYQMQKKDLCKNVSEISSEIHDDLVDINIVWTYFTKKMHGKWCRIWWRNRKSNLIGHV